MSGKNIKVFAIATSLLFGIGILVFILLFAARGGGVDLKDELLQTNKPEVVEYVYTQGTEQIRVATFDRADGKTIYYKEGATVKELPLGDNILVLCTEEDFVSLTVANYYQDEGTFFHPQQISEAIAPDETLAIVTSSKDGVSTAHTLIFDLTSCPEGPESMFN
jgi:hypothetical protein